MKIRDDRLLKRFSRKRRCEVCEQPRRCVPHHLWGRGCGGGLRADISINLIALCAGCHGLAHHRTEATRPVLVRIVAVRERLAPELILEVVPRIREWPKDVPLPAELAQYLEPVMPIRTCRGARP